MKDYYQVLGVDKNSSTEDIKRAYRKLAHQYHPDKPGGDEGKFKEVSEAYQVLSDTNKRAHYDRFGTSGDNIGGPGGQGYQGGFNWDFGNMAGAGFGNGGFTEFGDLGDIFETFFSGSGGGASRGRTHRRGSDIEIAMDISLEDAFRGVRREIRFSTLLKCEHCHGSGAEAGSKMKSCASCGGQGQIKEEKRTFFGNFAQLKVCPSCHGRGETPEKVCASCKGVGRIDGTRSFEVSILPGVQDGQIVKIQGAGEAGEHGAAEGDAFVHLRVAKHKEFERDGDDLIVRKNLDLDELLLSRKFELRGIDGKLVAVDVPNRLNFSQPIKISGEGMPKLNRAGRGDLLVEVSLDLPKKISSKAKKLLEELKGEIK